MRQSRRSFLDVLAGAFRTRVTIPGFGLPLVATRSIGAGGTGLAARRRGPRRPELPPGVNEIRISSNENPLGPGKAALDAILGKFPEAGRYPFNSTPADSSLVAAIAGEAQGQAGEHRPRRRLAGDPEERGARLGHRRRAASSRRSPTFENCDRLREAAQAAARPRSRSTPRCGSTSRR